MTRLRPRWIAALVVAGAVAAAARVAAAPGPEHARLTAMCGTWDVEMTFWTRPGGPGVATKGTSTIRPLFDGLFIEERIEGTLNGAPFTTLAWTGYNTATRQYEATRIASTNTIRIAETGSYDDKAKQFELKADYPFGADTWHQRTVIQPLSADAMTAASYLSFGAVPEWKGVEIKYTRRTKLAWTNESYSGTPSPHWPIGPRKCCATRHPHSPTSASRRPAGRRASSSATSRT